MCRSVVGAGQLDANSSRNPAANVCPSLPLEFAIDLNDM